MEDKDLKEVLKKAFIFVAVFIVFGGLLIKILMNNFTYEDVSVGKKIDKEETFLLLIVNEKNKKPKDIISLFADNDLSLEIVNSDREKYYDDFLFKLGINSYEIEEPSIIDIRDGKIVSILNNVKADEELDLFISSYGGLEEEE